MSNKIEKIVRDVPVQIRLSESEVLRDQWTANVLGCDVNALFREMRDFWHDHHELKVTKRHKRKNTSLGDAVSMHTESCELREVG